MKIPSPYYKYEGFKIQGSLLYLETSFRNYSLDLFFKLSKFKLKVKGRKSEELKFSYSDFLSCSNKFYHINALPNRLTEPGIKLVKCLPSINFSKFTSL